MLYHLLFPLRDTISGFNVFQYITFRTAMAAVTALLISFLIGPRVIAALRRRQVIEQIRTDGPASHSQKKGTPTMGGVIVLMAVILPTLLWANLANTYVHIVLVATVWMGLIGFVDDYLKNIRKEKRGLIAKYKLAGQILLGLVVALWVYLDPQFEGIETATQIPFFKYAIIDFGLLYALWAILVITGTSNAVNLTDGLDGLATGLLAISAAVFAAMAYVSGRFDFSSYLSIFFLPGAGELSVFCGAMMGACLGFLWFNAPPAEIFMGDTGSLATGAALGTLALLLKKEFVLLITGGVFVAESLSVLTQVSYFRFSKRRTGQGRRLFLMAPIHHHFELKGWKESQVVVRFWLLGILCALVALSTFKIR